VKKDENNVSKAYKKAEKNKVDSNKDKKENETDKSKKLIRKDKERTNSESEDEENQGKSKPPNREKGQRKKLIYPDKFDG